MRRAEGSVRVLTFKDGLLARVAHDLELHFERFELTLEGDVVRGEFPLRSLVVDGPIEAGVLRAERYDDGKRADVSRAMHADVLRTEQYPVARFTGTAVPAADGFQVDGQLELAGRVAPLSFPVRRDGAAFSASFDMAPSRWGITEYKALLGAIRLKDRVRIVLLLTEAPLPASAVGGYGET